VALAHSKASQAMLKVQDLLWCTYAHMLLLSRH